MRGTLGVRIVTPTQDRHVTKHVTGLSYESSAPGGGTTASMTLRMTRDTWPDIVGARLFIYDAATAEAMWDGWIDNPGESSTDDTESFELSAQGPSTLAQDKSRALWYIDTGLENFTDKYIFDVGTRIQGASEAVGDLPGVGNDTESDPDTEPDRPQAVVAQIPSGTVISHPYFCGMRWAGADGTDMRIRAYSFRTKNGFTDSNYRTRVTGFGGVDDVTASTTERVQRQVTARSFINVNLYLRRHAGGATTIPNDNYWGAFWEPLVKAELVDRWKRPVVPTLDRYWKVTAVVEDLAGRMIFGLDPALVTIEEAAYEIDQLLYKDGTRAAAVLEDLLKWEPDYTWTIDTTGSPNWGRGFHWFKTDTGVRYEISESDGVEFPGGDTDVATEAVVFWVDPKSGDQRRHTTIKTADPLSPAWEYTGGRIRSADPITLDEGKASKANAERAAQVVLETHQAPTRSGTANIARPIRDLQTGQPIQPWQLPLRVGARFRVRETGEVLPLTDVTYDDDDRSASLTLGQPAAELEDLLAAIPDAT